jgi:hypothetical protein
MVNVFLSTPCYGGVCLEEYAESIFKMQAIASQFNIGMSLDTTENESLVHRARNVSIARFKYKSECDYFMFIDADIQFDPMSIIRLIQSGHDVAVAAYPKKCIMWDQSAAAIKAGETKDPEKLATSLVLNFGTQQVTMVNGFAPVLDGPTGFMLIKRAVIDQMYNYYPELNCVNDHQNRDLETYCAIFDCMIDPVSKRYLSEDYAFCRRWQQMGGKIHADITTTLGHIGNLRFGGCLEDRLKTTQSLNA